MRAAGRVRPVAIPAPARVRWMAGFLVLLAGCGRDAEKRVRAEAERLLPEIEAITGIRTRAAVNVEVRDREELREYLIERLREELPPEELEAIRDVYAHLGLVPDTLDLGRLLLDLYTEQVAGYYDPKRETLYMIRGAPRSTMAPVLAHELVHALQDQVIDLDSLLEGTGRNDAETAAQAAVEGHAMVAMTLFQLRRSGAAADIEALPSIGDQLAAAQQGADFPVFQQAPRIVRASVLFPYVEGASFAQAVWVDAVRRTGAPPRMDALLPTSTEQVLHPRDRFIEARDEPTPLDLAPPPGWRARYENSLGEMELGVWLDTHRGEGARASAIGWDGDRYMLLAADSAEGAALLWWSVWDDGASADAFADAARGILARDRPSSAASLGGEVVRTTVDGRPLVGMWISALAAPGGFPLPAIPPTHGSPR